PLYVGSAKLPQPSVVFTTGPELVSVSAAVGPAAPALTVVVAVLPPLSDLRAQGCSCCVGARSLSPSRKPLNLWLKGHPHPASHTFHLESHCR
ncbi:hypothetical protein J6590_066114, partial [Homalodisca vitripennis]